MSGPYSMFSTIPAKNHDWWCPICRSAGDSSIQTLGEHVKLQHPDSWEAARL